MMKCPICGNTEFYTEQCVYRKVIVNADNEVIEEREEAWREEPAGQYFCTKCGADIDEAPPCEGSGV